MVETDNYTVTFHVALFYTQVEFNISQQLTSLEAIGLGSTPTVPQEKKKKKTQKKLLYFVYNKPYLAFLKKKLQFQIAGN